MGDKEGVDGTPEFPRIDAGEVPFDPVRVRLIREADPPGQAPAA